MNRIIAILTIFLLQLGCTQVAFAADNNVTVALHAFKVVATNNGTKLVATTEAMPGDTIEYQVTYSNVGTRPARDVLALLPVPQGGVSYVADSALPAAVQASVDGTTFAPMPLKRVVKRDGKQITEIVPVSEYRFLRWKLGEIPPGVSTTVSSRMRLDGAPVNNVRS